MTECEVEITEIVFEWGPAPEDLCPIRSCGGILRDHALEYEGPLGLGHSYEYRQCSRCEHICCLTEQHDVEEEFQSWAVV